MLATVASASLLGVRGHPIRVEVHVGQGLPAFSIVGLPDASCREARDRVRAAIISSNLEWPDTKITVNLAPSGVRKVGSGLDLAIAVGIVAATRRDLSLTAIDGIGFIGELGLDGSLRPVPGVLPLAAATGVDSVVVAARSHAEAALVPGLSVRSAPHLVDVVEALRGLAPWPDPPPAPPPPTRAAGFDLASVQGQPVARKAVEVAAAGGHHLLFVGPPGSGKTMLARALVEVLPPLDPIDALEVTTVHSASGLSVGGVMVERPPFRSPHHTASMVALVGGGSQAIRPGEVSCAHGGVLFLDELGEFPAAVLDALRQPLEEGVVRVARAYGAATLPARVLLVAAMNPCPCGEGLGGSRACRCSEAARQRYARRVSGPLLDRFDLRVIVGRPTAAALFSPEPGEGSAAVAARVAEARAIALDRGVATNAAIAPGDLDRLVPLTPRGRDALQHAMEHGRLSARGVHRVRRVARTLADLDGAEGPVDRAHVVAALAFRAPIGEHPAVVA